MDTQPIVPATQDQQAFVVQVIDRVRSKRQFILIDSFNTARRVANWPL